MSLNPNGIILWQGPSEIGGGDVVCIATGLADGSDNSKTGGMIQTWILPVDDFANAPSWSNCGDCPHAVLDTCYVAWGKAPRSVWHCFRRGGYRHATLEDFQALRLAGVRAGSAGDPAAVPAWIWALLQPRTGYTHQWRRPELQALRRFVMASCDTPADRELARALGWRCFEIGVDGESAPSGSIVCPATTAAALSCERCGLCNGSDREITGEYNARHRGARDIWIQVHGLAPKVARFTAARRSNALRVAA